MILTEPLAMKTPDITPGPWQRLTGDVISAGPIEDGGDIICSAPVEWEESMLRWKANATAIAALPAILEALKSVIASAHPDQQEHPEMFAAWQKGKSALIAAGCTESQPATTQV